MKHLWKWQQQIRRWFDQIYDQVKAQPASLGCDSLLPWLDSSPSGLVTESFPPKSELHSDRRSSILLGMSSDVALIPGAPTEKLVRLKLRTKQNHLYWETLVPGNCPKEEKKHLNGRIILRQKRIFLSLDYAIWSLSGGSPLGSLNW